MIRRPITSSEVAFVQRHYGRDLTALAIARRLRRPLGTIKTIAHRHGLKGCCRFIQPAAIAYVRAHAHEPIAAVAAALGVTYSSAAQLRVRLGLAQRRPHHGSAFAATLRAKHAQGWSDAEIAALTGAERHTVGLWRKRMGLADNNLSAHRRHRVSLKTRAQCRRLGIKSLEELRYREYRQFALSQGLPADLRPRAVQLVNFLIKHGPATRKEIAAGIGMPWKGSRASLHSNDPEGSYQAHLIARGLVVALKRAVKGRGRGHSVNLYMVPVPVASEIMQRRDALQRSAHEQKHAA